MGFDKHLHAGALRPAPALPLALFTLGCQALTSIDVRYQDCVEPTTPYVAQFDGGTRELEQQCWRIDGTGSGRSVATSGGDLLIGYDSPPEATVGWADDGPALVRQVRGDF